QIFEALITGALQKDATVALPELASKELVEIKTTGGEIIDGDRSITDALDMMRLHGLEMAFYDVDSRMKLAETEAERNTLWRDQADIAREIRDFVKNSKLGSKAYRGTTKLNLGRKWLRS